MGWIKKFTGGNPSVRGKLNQIGEQSNVLQSISGDQYINVNRNGSGLGLSLNLATVLSRMPRVGGGGGTSWVWARVREVLSGDGIDLAVRVCPLKANYARVTPDDADHWLYVYLWGYECSAAAQTDPNTGSTCRMEGIAPQYVEGRWNAGVDTGSLIQIVRGYDGFYWNAAPFTELGLLGGQRAKVISCGTNTLICKRIDNNQVVYGPELTVYVQGVGASRALTDSPVLANASPLFAAGNLIIIRWFPGLNSWAWVGLAPETEACP